MSTNLDDLLGTLRERPLDVSLDGLEGGVWARVEAQRRARADSAGGLRMQVAVAVVALLLGAVLGGATADRQPGRNEMVVMSEAGALAPSVALEGGA